MYKLIYIFIFNCFIIAALFAQSKTRIIKHRVITGEERWSGTILIKGDVVVARTGRLYIEPGTQIQFAPDQDLSRSGYDKTRSELIVKGSIFARGDINRKIVFSSAAPRPRMKDWYGIEIQNLKNPAMFEYVVVEYAYNGFEIKKSNPSIKNCQIQFNYNAGIRVAVRAKSRLIGNIITDNGYAGMICETGAQPVLSDNMINNNQIGVIIFGSAQPNLGNLQKGKDYNPGRNALFDNLEYDLYNHGNKDIKAEGNSWGSKNRDQILKQIFDGTDDGRYGLVDFNPIIGNIDLERKILLAQQSQKIEGDTLSSQSLTADSAKIAKLTVPETRRNLPIKNITDSAKIIAATDKSARETKDTSLALSQPEKPAAGTDSVKAEKPVVESGNKTENNKKKLLSSIDFDQVFMDVFLDKKAEVVKKVAPIIDNPSRGMYDHGRVIVRVTIGKDGKVEDAKILRGLNYYYDDLALNAAKKFIYKPGTVKGVTVRFSTSILFQF